MYVRKVMRLEYGHSGRQVMSIREQLCHVYNQFEVRIFDGIHHHAPCTRAPMSNKVADISDVNRATGL